MAKIKLNQKAVEKTVARITRGRLDLAGQFVVTAAKINITNNKTVDKGNLRNSMDHRVVSDDAVSIFNTAFYAPSVELGARAILKKFLTIPINNRSKGKRAADFPELFRLPKTNLLVINEGGKVIPLFVLKKETRPYPFLRPAVFNNLGNIKQILDIRK